MSKILQILLIILIMTTNVSFAEGPVSGEIINISYQYKIAFTDLTDYQIKDGEIVEIHENGKLLTYLEVDSASEMISKLVPVKNNKNFMTNVPFSQVQVGNIVIKKETPPATANTEEDKSNLKTTAQPVSQEASSASKLQELSENYMILSNTLAQTLNEKAIAEAEMLQTKQELDAAIRRIQELEAQSALLDEELKALESKGSLKKSQERIKQLEKTIETLRKKLEKMALLLEGK